MLYKYSHKARFCFQTFVCDVFSYAEGGDFMASGSLELDQYIDNKS